MEDSGDPLAKVGRVTLIHAQYRPQCRQTSTVLDACHVI
jgi:hypothetical protein